MKSWILVAITHFLFSCSEEQFNPADSTVHLAGFIGNPDGGSVASYWKDGVYRDLTNNNINSQVNSLYVDGSSVLIGGWKRADNSLPPAVIWKDGKETVIDGTFGDPTLIASRNDKLFGVWSEGLPGWVLHRNGIKLPMTDTAYNFGPTALALLGEDMYISGCSVGPTLQEPPYHTSQYAQCWKNGQLIFRESEDSYAISIFIHQSDIYMAGYLYGYSSPNIACYWKNGQRVTLTEGNVNAIATSVFATDTHVYASGTINDQAVYWKDGVAINLTTEGTFSMANSIFVQGTDVHVAGYEHGYPAYWKNDVRQNIANQDRLGQVKFVVVGAN